MRVTIMIAAHNEGSALARTIESCIDTVHSVEYEIVGVDHASSDGSVDEAQSRFPLARLYRHDRVWGTSPAKAAGADMRPGAILVFLDGHCNPEQGATLDS